MPDQASQTRMTGIAKNERKNTRSPGGTCGADALMQTAISDEEQDGERP